MKQESGRSMIEILGVLAIMGVLSIGGIAGYTIAMNRFRANEMLDLAARVATVAMTKSGTEQATLADVTTQVEPYGVTSMTADSTGVVEAQVKAEALTPGIQNAMNTIAGDKVKVQDESFTFYPEGNAPKE